MNELPTQYNPKDSEDKWYGFWEENNYFNAKNNPSKKPFSIVIPPPNVTGILHMGHALNNTIQDILIRHHRMLGEESLWMPGTDHAGIATQNVVEKSIAKEKLKRQDLGRDKFLKRVWEWKEEYGSTIIRQLKKLGSSCDWQRERFTMDDEYSRAVIEVFVRLYEKKLIYRGSYIINWCPRCQTALSDEEAPHREMQGNLYYIKYPLKKKGFIVVATTRPETMLGDTAVAVHPKDRRYKKLVGEKIVLPLLDRQIPVISDAMVDKKFGTGAVKVTPAHDANDYALGRKHKLEFINIMHPDARLNENAGRYQGLDRFKAREQILNDLKEKDLLEKIQDHKLSAGHCYRCQTIIEPYLSRQWFVKMKPLAKPAIEAVKKNKIKFYPARWRKVYLNWMENIQDWCISRQIWWGHRIPVYYCRQCQDKGDQGIIVTRVKPKVCPACSSTQIYQDDDVLDTWFSSWLWPFATFGWPFQSAENDNLKTKNQQQKTDLDYFYPTSALVTAPEIIFFWVARMIMAGLEFMKEVPFKDVYIHGTVRDIEGRKMSKSLGNIIDPLEVIEHIGCDALRFSLISITAVGQDVFLSEERFRRGRNFANKIWNASRLILMNFNQENARVDLCAFFKKEDLDMVNRWILSRFYTTLKKVNRSLEEFRFNEAANLLYQFFWHEFCDWYLEIIKPKIKEAHVQIILYKVLEKFLRLLHPFMPFISEEIWHALDPKADSIMIQSWPHIQQQIIDSATEKKMATFCEVINTVRNMRSELRILPQNQIRAKIYVNNKEKESLLKSMQWEIRNLSKINLLEFGTVYRHARSQYVKVIKDIHIAIPLEGVIDTEKFRREKEQEIERTTSDLDNKKRLLDNENFISKAPKDIVEKEKAKLDELKQTLKKLKVVRDGFK